MLQNIINLLVQNKNILVDDHDLPFFSVRKHLKIGQIYNFVHAKYVFLLWVCPPVPLADSRPTIPALSLNSFPLKIGLGHTKPF